jgi:hypothetical protein
MEPEQLKVIAEGMGYTGLHITNGKVGTNNWTKSHTILTDYNPLTDAEQILDIIVKCELTVGIDPSGDGRYVKKWGADIYEYELYNFPINDPMFAEEENKMIRRLVCKAAFKHFMDGSM